MKRSSILASTAVLSLFSVIAVQACSSDEGGDDNDTMTPGLNPGMGGTGGAAPGAGMGGTAPVATNGGTGNVAEGQGGAPVATTGGTTGTSPVNNMGGAPAGMGGAPAGMGGAPVGMGGTPPVGGPPVCIEPPSPSDGVNCTATCTDICGIQRLGARVCTCPGTIPCDDGGAGPCYDCASCGYLSNHPLIEPPTAAFPPCAQNDAGMEGQTPPPCASDSQRCQSTSDPDRFCGCLTAGGEWDCDSKPDNFLF